MKIHNKIVGREISMVAVGTAFARVTGSIAGLRAMDSENYGTDYYYAAHNQPVWP